MPSLCGYTWSDALDTIIVQKCQEHGCPLDLAYAVIAGESGFDVAALGDAGCSSGLLQLNTCGGQGTGYTVLELRDPELNLDIGLPPIAAAFRQVWTPVIPQLDFIIGVCLNSGHPCNSPDTVCSPGILCGDPASTCYASAVRIYNLWLCFFSALVAAGGIDPPQLTGAGGATGTPPYPTPVIAPLQNGQPIVVFSQSEQDIWPLIAIGAIGIGTFLALQKQDILKKIKIKYPSGPITINK